MLNKFFKISKFTFFANFLFLLLMINLVKDKVHLYFIKTWVGNGWDSCTPA